jgi:hypothetical protein
MTFSALMLNVMYNVSILFSKLTGVPKTVPFGAPELTLFTEQSWHGQRRRMRGVSYVISMEELRNANTILLQSLNRRHHS